ESSSKARKTIMPSTEAVIPSQRPTTASMRSNQLRTTPLATPRVSLTSSTTQSTPAASQARRRQPQGPPT
ncbi:hypothetical protein NW755_014818, partial [Fusarium falciforme]